MPTGRTCARVCLVGMRTYLLHCQPWYIRRLGPTQIMLHKLVHFDVL